MTEKDKAIDNELNTNVQEQGNAQETYTRGIRNFKNK